MDQDDKDLQNNEPVAVTSTVDAQPTPQTETRQERTALFPRELTALVLSRQSQATTTVPIENPRAYVPRVDGEGIASTTKEPGSDGVPASTGRIPPRTPFIPFPPPRAPRQKPSRAARWFLILFKLVYKCFKIV